MPLSLRPASGFDSCALADVLNASYRDYAAPIQFTADQYEFFVSSHDVDPGLSVVAEAAGKPVGLAQLARRGGRGWVAGVGVEPEYRRQGIARAMMEALMGNARAAGLERLQLEVLQQNEAALALYQDLGWCIERELLTWSRPVEQGPLPIPAELLVEMDPLALLDAGFRWHDQPPCWQREHTTLGSFAAAGLRGWTLLRNDRPAGYVLGFSPHEGQMTLVDVVVDPAYGIRSAGRPLIQALHLRFLDMTTRLANEPVDSVLNHLFAALTYRVIFRQHEMMLNFV